MDSTVLDYETTPKFSLLVQASDGTLNDSAIVTVNLTDVDEDIITTNQAPTITAATFNLAENSSNGTVVGTIQALDPDGDTLSYTILSGNTGQAFSLNSSTGVLIVVDSTALDYETTPAFSLLVQASDGSLSDSAFFNINLMETGNLPILSIDDVMQMVYPNPSMRVMNIKMDQFKKARIYNLSGQSSVSISFEQPLETLEIIAIATINILESMRFLGSNFLFYNASSSESFGDTGALPSN